MNDKEIYDLNKKISNEIELIDNVVLKIRAKDLWENLYNIIININEIKLQCEICAAKCFFCIHFDKLMCSKLEKPIKSVLNHSSKEHIDCSNYKLYDVVK